MPGSVLLSETRERFVRAIVAHVPAERIFEVYFFPPLRQGGVESGVAVVVAVSEGELAACDTASQGERPAAGEATSGAAATDAGATDARATDAGATDARATDAGATDAGATDAGASGVAARGEAAGRTGEGADDAGVAERGAPPEDHVTAAAADVHHHSDADGTVTPPEISNAAPGPSDELPASAELAALVAADLTGASPDAATEPAASSRRYTVYTAAVRVQLRGSDRGKWDTSVVAVADAPLVTIDAVVRGVQRRSGDLEDPERMTGEEIRATLRA